LGVDVLLKRPLIGHAHLQRPGIRQFDVGRLARLQRGTERENEQTDNRGNEAAFHVFS
jgi:hypothetical protein